MPLAIPPELKKISPYVRRAEELDRDPSPESRLVAYYCRQYAVHVGIPLAGSSAAAKTCLGHLLENLEGEKPAMDNFTRDEAAFLCRKFANKVFEKADGEDRMGLANQRTAKTFYAAASFLQILEQFYNEEEESEEQAEDRKRILYAKWKSTEILKAMKEGRTPTPGGYGEDMESDEEEGEEIEVTHDAQKKKEDAPTMLVETVSEDEEEEQEEEIMAPPPAPMAPPVPQEAPKEESDHEEDEPNEEGTEVELGPPPAYPGDDGPAATESRPLDRPKVTFELPPPVQPAPLPVVPPKQKTGGIFGFKGGKKKGGTVSKAQIADAVELTNFALAALQDKDVELGAERLQQALQALGR